MKTLRELITEYCTTQGFSTDEDILEECLKESFDEVFRGDEDAHRWYSNYWVVVAIPDGESTRYFEYRHCEPNQDGSSAEDCGYVFEGIDNIREVYPKQVLTTIYTGEKQ